MEKVAAGMLAGKAALFIGGPAALAGGPLEQAARCCQATSAELICENAFARVDRGAGRPAVSRLEYFPADAKKQLAAFDTLIVIGARVNRSPTHPHPHTHTPRQPSFCPVSGAAVLRCGRVSSHFHVRFCAGRANDLRTVAGAGRNVRL